MSVEGSTQLKRLDLIGHLRRRPGLRKTLIWCLAAAVALAAILTALPIAVARYAEDWLKDNGAVSARIEDLDINLFTGVVRVFGLQASGGARERLHIGSAELGIRWWPLTSQRVHVEFLKLADGQVDVAAVDAGAWQIGAVTIRPAEAGADPEPAEVEVSAGEASDWGWGSEGVALTNLQLTYRDALFDTTVDVRDFRVGSQFTWDAGRTTALEIDLSIDGSPLVISSNALPWAEQRQLTGAVKLSDLNLGDYREVLQELVGLGDPRGTINFDLQLNAAYDADGTVELRISGPLEVLKAGFALDDMAITNDALRWRGEVGLKLPVPEEGSLLRVEGDLQLADTRAVLGGLELAAGLSTLGWKGVMEFSPARSADASVELGIRSILTGTGFTLDHARLPFHLAALDKIDATSIEVNGVEQASTQQLQLSGLRLIGNPEGTAQVPDVLTLELLELEGFNFDAQGGLTAEALVLHALKTSLVRNEKGELERIAAAIAVFTDTGEASDEKTDGVQPTERADTSVPLKVVVEDVRIQADTLLRFEDRAVTPVAIFNLTKTDLEIKHLDSSGNKPMDLRLITGDGNMKLTADGTVNAFAETLSADLAIQLTALDLSQISAYVPGYNIERGRLSTDSNLVLNGDTLGVQNDLLIERLKLSGKAGEGNDPLAQGMAMPIDVALNLLRDGDDRIKLKLPVSGSLADPKFGTGDILRQATQKALQNTAMSFVKNALQPLGTLMLVGNLAAKAARPRFEPVAMTPGDASLSGTGREYLQKLGALLTERPGLQLTICGVATPADRQVLASMAMASGAQEIAPESPDAASNRSDLAASATSSIEPETADVSDAQLLELAALRTSAVIGFLVSEEGIVQERLFACRETIETSDEEGPRAEISL